MAHAERAVTNLPGKRLLVRNVFMNPAGGIRFQLAHQIRQRMFRRQRSQNMNVISRSVDDERLVVVRTNDAAEIWKQTGFQIRIQQRRAIFGAKDNVCQQMGEGMGHKSKLRSAESWFSVAPARGLGNMLAIKPIAGAMGYYRALLRSLFAGEEYEGFQFQWFDFNAKAQRRGEIHESIYQVDDIFRHDESWRGNLRKRQRGHRVWFGSVLFCRRAA
jgi:hypothetical protein